MSQPPHDRTRHRGAGLGERLRSRLRGEDQTETMELPPATRQRARPPLPPLAGAPAAPGSRRPADLAPRRDGIARAVALGALTAAILAAAVLALALARPATVGLARSSDVHDAVAAVAASISNLEADIAQIEGRVSELESGALSAEEVERGVEMVRVRVEELAQDLSGLRPEVARVDADGLGARIEAVERRLDIALARLSDAEQAARDDDGGGYCPTFLPLC